MHKSLPVGPMTHWKPNINCSTTNKTNINFSFTCTNNWTSLDTSESLFVYWWLNEELPTNLNILSIRSATHSGGKVLFEIYSRPDLFISTNEENNKNNISIFIIQYDGVPWYIIINIFEIILSLRDS